LVVLRRRDRDPRLLAGVRHVAHRGAARRASSASRDHTRSGRHEEQVRTRGVPRVPAFRGQFSRFVRIDRLPDQAVATFLRKLRQHSALSSREERALARLRPHLVEAARGADLVRQGDRPDVSIFLLRGMLARYHTLAEGERQYLALHIAGDLPDLQSLFLGAMDHSLVALDQVQIACFKHDALCRLIEDEPQVGIALWRQTLLDAAIFREAITNIGLRKPVERLAHVLCEQFVRAQAADICEGKFVQLSAHPDAARPAARHVVGVGEPRAGAAAPGPLDGVARRAIDRARLEEAEGPRRVRPDLPPPRSARCGRGHAPVRRAVAA